MSNENPYAPPDSDISVPEPGELAGRGTRLGGAIIDGLIMMAIVWPLMYVAGFWEKAMAGEQTFVDTVLLGVMGIGGFLLLNGYLMANYGQTIGKRILKMRIVSIDDDKILPFWRLVGLRYLPIWILSQIPVVAQIVGLVDPLFIFRQDRRCVHDLIAGTKVIKA